MTSGKEEAMNYQAIKSEDGLWATVLHFTQPVVSGLQPLSKHVFPHHQVHCANIINYPFMELFILQKYHFCSRISHVFYRLRHYLEMDLSIQGNHLPPLLLTTRHTNLRHRPTSTRLGASSATTFCGVSRCRVCVARTAA